MKDIWTFFSNENYLSAELRKGHVLYVITELFLSSLLHNAIIACATSCNTLRCFVSILLIHDRFYARSLHRVRPVFAAGSTHCHKRLGRAKPQTEWMVSPPPSVPKIYRSRERRLRASYRLSQRDVTRLTMKPQPVDRLSRFVSL